VVRPLLALVLAAVVVVLGTGLPFIFELPLALLVSVYALTVLPGTAGRNRVPVVIALALLAVIVIESTLLALGAMGA
jgi:hypothetical protein